MGVYCRDHLRFSFVLCLRGRKGTSVIELDHQQSENVHSHEERLKDREKKIGNQKTEKNESAKLAS